MVFRVAEFQISDYHITRFRRFVKKPMDCVINALEIIGILDDIRADILRIAVGDQGLNTDQIVSIFKLLKPLFKWRFFRYTNLETLSQYTVNEMKHGHVVFCGYRGYNPVTETYVGHVFLIGKYLNGNLVYIDPQIPTVCRLDDDQCQNLIKNKQEYFILQYSPINQ